MCIRFCRSASSFSGVLLLLLLARPGNAIVNSAGQLFLPLQLRHSVIAGLAHRSVPRDFAGFDGASALPCRMVMLARRNECRPKPESRIRRPPLRS